MNRVNWDSSPLDKVPPSLPANLRETIFDYLPPPVSTTPVIEDLAYKYRNGQLTGKDMMAMQAAAFILPHSPDFHQNVGTCSARELRKRRLQATLFPRFSASWWRRTRMWIDCTTVTSGWKCLKNCGDSPAIRRAWYSLPSLKAMPVPVGTCCWHRTDLIPWYLVTIHLACRRTGLAQFPTIANGRSNSARTRLRNGCTTTFSHLPNTIDSTSSGFVRTIQTAGANNWE
ncbi:MAG: hypothetical protein JWN70_5922 [Planctomycetaceae bacterium]|nr:hypothetical protein [Planctomycetaceae bacterium]